MIDQFRRRLVEGMLTCGMPQEYADATFQQIRGFGEYGFPESHAASFALLVYVSAWLKHHHPAAFCAALLNSQPMGFYAPAQLVRDARGHGVEVLPVDVNHSDWDCTLEAHNSQWALRLGFRMLQGLAEVHGRRIEQSRGGRPFCSMEDFSRRSCLSRTVSTRLAKGGAFASLELDRRGSLWHALAQQQRAMPLFDSLAPEKDEAAALPGMSAAEEVLADYRTTGMSLKAHPLAFLREELDRRKVARAEQLKTWPNGHPIRVAGIVLVRQRPTTAKGITFVTLEDETGAANLIIRPDVWQRWRQAALGAKVLLAHGRLQRHGQVIHVVATKLENVSDLLQDLTAKSRDFC